MSGWFGRLKAGLAKSSGRLGQELAQVFAGGKLDQAALDALEEALIAADLGPATAKALAREIAKTRFGKDVSEAEGRAALADAIERLLVPVAKPLVVDASARPFVVLVVGVNGTGKTTTIGKLAHQLAAEGRSVVLCAADTFRAAAIEQLEIWGERAGAPVIAREPGANPAGLVFDAIEETRRRGADVLLVDTAGRLHNKAHLMAELEKIIRVMRKLDPAAPHATLLVLDATTGQNAHAQVEVFKTAAPVTGLVVTKLDGSAKGGVVVALAERFGIPVVAVGVGEGLEDLRPFAPRDFARGLLGLGD